MGNGIGYPGCSSNEEHNSLFRSEKMTLCQLFLQSEAAYTVIAELGELGLLQFKDLNPDLSAFQRKFVNEVRQCEEMERILRFLEGEIKKEKIKPVGLEQIPAAPLPKEIRDIQDELGKLEGDLKDVNANRNQLKSNYLELMELQVVLKASEHFLEEISELSELENIAETTFHGASAAGSGIAKREPTAGDIEMGEKSETVPATSFGADGSMRLNFLTGTLPTEKLNGFERMLWFACRGNVYLRYTEIAETFEEPTTGDPIRKSVFCVFFQGDKLKQKVSKICEGFRCNIYTIPKTVEERTRMSQELAQRVGDIHVVLEKTEDHRKRLLVNTSKDVRSLAVKVLKTKAIYHTLNMFNMDVTQKCLIAECWAPVRDLEKVNQAITEGTSKSNSEVPSVLNRLTTNETIPTFNRTNKFTKAFQSIVDAYGIGRYQEVNPAIFTIITFPFIFAIMFGDCAHGVVMSCFALWMVIKEKKFLKNKGSNEIWNMIFGGRYIILLMGLFSIYTGFIYNDFFSKSVNLFGSSWRVTKYYPDASHHGNSTDLANTTLVGNSTAFENITDLSNTTGHGSDHPYYINGHLYIDLHHVPAFTHLQSYNRTGTVYPIGVDPIWMIASNKITFINSYKMKMSIAVGIIQMLFGLILSFLNHCYFRSWKSIFCEFIPEMIFILSIFGYMLLLIVLKWLTVFNITSCAPSILVGFINMFLFSYPAEIPGCNPQFVLFNDLATMKMVQTILVGAAGICIPWLLIVKPVVIGIQRCFSNKNGAAPLNEDDNAALHGNGHHPAGVEAQMSQTDEEDVGTEEHGMGEVIVHQCIHTIEYCLGCVSNTASYLRLWALSLAHAQLSEVLWNMVLKTGLTMNSGFTGAAMLSITFAPFACLTVAVLLMMEGLSAFLHALRLHWVEFNSKFFYGDGVKFLPFTFKEATAARLTADSD